MITSYCCLSSSSFSLDARVRPMRVASPAEHQQNRQQQQQSPACEDLLIATDHTTLHTASQDGAARL
jgi:hypothetical protein